MKIMYLIFWGGKRRLYHTINHLILIDLRLLQKIIFLCPKMSVFSIDLLDIYYLKLHTHGV